ncbi:MAG: AAA family ATPase [Nanoarchaeota archaeon]
MCKVIGILSLKGGVGKTSTVISLGDAISDFGKKVLLVDGNLSAPNLGLHLKIVEPRVTLHHVLGREANVVSSIHKFGNFDVIPASVFGSISVNPFELRDKIKLLKRKYDFIVIDSSPSMNDETLAVMLASDELIIVTTPDVPTLSMTLRAVKLAKRRNTPINGLVLNKVHNKDFELTLEEIENVSGVPVLAVIPYDIDILKSLSNFSPYTSYRKNSKGSVEYRKLAGILVGEKYNPFSLRNFFQITPKRQEINREIFYDRVFG